MSDKPVTRFLMTLGAVLLLAMALGVACGGGSESGDEAPQATETGETSEPGNTSPPNGTTDPNETVDPDATPPSHENGSIGDPAPTEDLVAEETRQNIRSIERSVRKLGSLLRILGTRVAQGGRSAFGTPEGPDVDWFDECCDDSLGDFSEELRDISRELPELVEIYEEADDQESLELVERIGSEVANIDASLSVLASLPDGSSAGTLLEEISLEIDALADAVTNLR